MQALGVVHEAKKSRQSPGNEKPNQSKLSADQSQSPVSYFRFLWENCRIVSSPNRRKLCFYSSGDLKDLDQGGSLVGPDERALVGVWMPMSLLRSPSVE